MQSRNSASTATTPHRPRKGQNSAKQSAGGESSACGTAEQSARNHAARTQSSRADPEPTRSAAANASTERSPTAAHASGGDQASAASAPGTESADTRGEKAGRGTEEEGKAAASEWLEAEASKRVGHMNSTGHPESSQDALFFYRTAIHAKN